MIPLFGVSLIFSILMCVHAVKSGRELYWLFIILIFQPVGGLVYLVTQFLPEALGGSTARTIKKAAVETLDPTRAYREAQQAVEDSPTVGARMRLAQAAAALGRHEEAERLFREAAHGIHDEDPALLMGRAQSLVELGRDEEALEVLNKLGEQGDKGRTPQAALATARALHSLGRYGEADGFFGWASETMPGLEASARYAVFLRETGREDEASALITDLDKRAAKASGPFRKEARHWRDHARSGVSKGSELASR